MSKSQLKIDSHVVIQLGAELISDSEQALLELVKNAYDADATKCTISIEPHWSPEKDHEWHSHLKSVIKNSPPNNAGRIVIRDNGTGLNTSAVDNGWLLISASLKRNTGGSKIPTPGGRIPVGDKGLGRLATMRLGDVLSLKTMTEGEAKTRTISFSWTSFHMGIALEDIEVKTSIAPPLKGRRCGSDIEILGLIEPNYWESEANLNKIISKLSTLISPFERFKDFQVNIRANEQEHDLHAISAEALNFASAKFEFKFENSKLNLKAYIAKSLFRGSSGEQNRKLFDRLLAEENLPEVLCHFEADPKIVKRRFQNLTKEKGGWLFSLEEEIAWEDIPRDSQLHGAISPGPFYGELYNFMFNDYTKEQLVAASVPLGMLQEMTTIGVFRDRFRVRMSDDWLALAKGVTSGGFFQLRPRNVIGFFAITNEFNPNLVEKSDREGFVDNESWRGFQLLANRTKKFANDSLDAVRTAYETYKNPKVSQGKSIPNESPHRAGAILSDKKSKVMDSLQELRTKNDSFTKNLRKAKNQVIALKIEPSGQSNFKTVVDELTKIENEFQQINLVASNIDTIAQDGMDAATGVALTNQELHLQNLRLLDAAAVGLSARALVHEINTHLGNLNRGLAQITRANNSKSEPDEKITRTLTAIASVVRELKKTISTIDPLTAGSRSVKDTFNTREAVESFFRQRESRLSDLHVTFNIKGNTGFLIKFSKVRFAQILENLFQNSLYWIDEHSHNDSTVKRKINVEFNQTGFIWHDEAKGVREAIEDTIFDAYVTDKPENKGQGLGLFIVTAFLHAEKCGISLLDEKNRYQRRYKFSLDFSGAMQ